MWLAGAGVKGGQAIGATDELGFNAVEDRCHVSDLHATILHLMGLDHTASDLLLPGLRPSFDWGSRPGRHQSSGMSRWVVAKTQGAA